MEAYNDPGSGINGFEFVNRGIILLFKNVRYLYDYTKPGKEHVEKMKKLALKGKGLNTYVNKFVRTSYKEKLD